MVVLTKILFLFIISTNLSCGNCAQPADCLSTCSNADSLIKCMQNFIIRNETEPLQQPTSVQREAWSETIVNLLNSDENCTEIEIDKSLAGIYSIGRFTDEKTSYCVFYETKIVDQRFANGWGLFIVPYSVNSTKLPMVHLSVSHPFTDGSVHIQAANLFDRTDAKSLLISGVIRNASNEKSKCDDRYYRLDGSHDKETMFHTANLAVRKWQLSQRGCPWSKCAFIQLHGKSKSCNSTSVFLSTGLGRSSGSLEFYKNISLPVQRLKNRLKKAFGKKLTVKTPLDDKTCQLTAGSNIFGRVINGVNVGQECQVSADATTATGYFIHVEQSSKARRKSSYSRWAKAIVQTFK